MADRYDVIVVGGGHNGLVAAAYMAMAGLNTLVLERRELVGGACVTEELIPGYKFSSCAYVSWMLQPKVVADLELRRHGFDVYSQDPYLTQPFPDGHRVLFWQDDRRTEEEIARISPRDVEAYRSWWKFWSRAAEIFQPYLLTSPPTLEEIGDRLQGTEYQDVFNTLLTVSFRDLLDDFFESDQVKACFVSAPDLQGPRAVGSALSSAYYACSILTNPEDQGIPKGGMGGLTQAMARAARSHGVTIRTGAAVKRILVRGGKAYGVMLADGEEIESILVVSNADPLQTFLRLIGPDELDRGFVEQLGRLKTDMAHLKLHCALREAPDFSRYLDKEQDGLRLGLIKICPSVEYFEKSCEDTRQGTFTDCPVFEIQMPSAYDPTLAPDGHHVLSAFVFHAPRRLVGRSWEEAREEIANELIDKITEYAPNFRDSIIDWRLFTPQDMEQRMGFTNGNIHHLDLVPSQMLSRRPLPGWSDYRTPIQGLYLCGAGTHPGGEVTGAPGHNAAHAVLEDWERNA